METPLKVSFKNCESSEALEETIREKLGNLEKISDKLISCHVTIEKPHRHHAKGSPFHVRIDLAVPDKEIVVGKDPGDAHAHEDAYTATRDAFKAAKRLLTEYLEVRRGHVKTHSE